MPKLTRSLPSLRRHKASGQAVVTLSGRDLYLGPWGSRPAKREYERLIGEWLAAGRVLPAESNVIGTTVAELAAAYLRFAKGYYRKDGEPTGSLDRVKIALKTLRTLYGRTEAAAFGPLALQAIQGRLVADGKARSYVNHLVETIRRVFKWGVSQELVPASVFQALATVPGLRRGRTEAREPKPIMPVAESIVDATLPRMPPIVADMVRLQRLTGARPGEICILRPCDVDRSGDVWAYRPASHKTEHHGRERIIFIGPKAQAILAPYLLRAADAFCFSPREAVETKRAERREARQTPMTPSQSRRRRKRKPRRAPGDCYTFRSYGRAIARACTAAKVDVGMPNRLRHSAATEIRSRYGLEAAATVLGHAQANVTQIYAERDLTKAAAIMREVG
ncbi:MAG: site-specific integrase [Planctomycetota bacterium]|nr:MAG: site-specific integrase [Planctomycetota bacterium]